VIDTISTYAKAIARKSERSKQYQSRELTLLLSIKEGKIRSILLLMRHLRNLRRGKGNKMCVVKKAMVKHVRRETDTERET
jgi:hypothetical protein